MIDPLKLKKVTELLKRDFPEVDTPLLHQSAFQLVIATMFSAQTLDASVNKVTPVLFEKYPTVELMAEADLEIIDRIIIGVNYHRTKSRNAVLTSKKLLSDFNGIVPHTIEDLIKLPGVGRKTANVVISEWFAKPLNMRGTPNRVDPKFIKKGEDIKVPPEGFVVDTHVIRISNRLGLTKSKDPKIIEQDLMKLWPKEEWNAMSLRIIFHGRTHCKAKQNMCCKDPEWSQLCEC